jgi:hypothetical protein
MARLGYARAFQVASLLATDPTTNCGTDSTVMATRDSGQSDSEFPADSIAIAWPTAILMVQRQLGEESDSRVQRSART